MDRGDGKEPGVQREWWRPIALAVVLVGLVGALLWWSQSLEEPRCKEALPGVVMVADHEVIHCDVRPPQRLDIIMTGYTPAFAAIRCDEMGGQLDEGPGLDGEDVEVCAGVDY